VFNAPEEAEAAAKQLVIPNEIYAIDQFDGDCPRCNDTGKLGRSDSSRGLTKPEPPYADVG